MDPNFARETRGIVDEAIGGLSRAPGPTGQPQFFFVVSRATRFIVNVTLAPAPSVDLDELLLAIYDFIESQSTLEDGNIYLTRLHEVSILIEPSGGAMLAEAFDGGVERSHYKEFHRAVRHLQKDFPDLGRWDGRPQTLPDQFRERLRSSLDPRPPSVEPPRATPDATASPATAAFRPAPVRPGAPARMPGDGARPEPDIQDCERKMREWYKRGLKIDRLKEALHRDWAALIATFEDYERDLARLDRFRACLEGLKGLGFDDELHRLGATLNDPGKVMEVEAQASGLAARIKEKYTIRLPVTEPKRVAEAIRGLPLGIPSSLWGIPLDTLVREYLSADKGIAPDGSTVVWLRGAWYIADPASPAFLNVFSGTVRRQAEMFPSDAVMAHLEELLSGRD